MNLENGKYNASGSGKKRKNVQNENDDVGNISKKRSGDYSDTSKGIAGLQIQGDSRQDSRLGVLEFCQTLMADNQDEYQIRKKCEILKKFVNTIRRERKLSQSDSQDLYLEAHEDECILESVCSKNESEGEDNNKAGNEKFAAKWMKDTKGYGVPLVMTAIGKGETGTVVSGVWPTGFLQVYLSKSPRAVELMQNSSLHLSQDQGTLKQEIAIWHYLALAELLTACTQFRPSNNSSISPKSINDQLVTLLLHPQFENPINKERKEKCLRILSLLDLMVIQIQQFIKKVQYHNRRPSISKQNKKHDAEKVGKILKQQPDHIMQAESASAALYVMETLVIEKGHPMSHYLHRSVSQAFWNIGEGINSKHHRGSDTAFHTLFMPQPFTCKYGLLSVRIHALGIATRLLNRSSDEVVLRRLTNSFPASSAKTMKKSLFVKQSPGIITVALHASVIDHNEGGQDETEARSYLLRISSFFHALRSRLISLSHDSKICHQHLFQNANIFHILWSHWLKPQYSPSLVTFQQVLNATDQYDDDLDDIIPSYHKVAIEVRRIVFAIVTSPILFPPKAKMHSPGNLQTAAKLLTCIMESKWYKADSEEKRFLIYCLNKTPAIVPFFFQMLSPPQQNKPISKLKLEQTIAWLKNLREIINGITDGARENAFSFAAMLNSPSFQVIGDLFVDIQNDTLVVNDLSETAVTSSKMRRRLPDYILYSIMPKCLCKSLLTKVILFGSEVVSFTRASSSNQESNIHISAIGEMNVADNDTNHDGKVMKALQIWMVSEGLKLLQAVIGRVESVVIGVDLLISDEEGFTEQRQLKCKAFQIILQDAISRKVPDMQAFMVLRSQLENNLTGQAASQDSSLIDSEVYVELTKQLYKTLQLLYNLPCLSDVVASCSIDWTKSISCSKYELNMKTKNEIQICLLETLETLTRSTEVCSFSRKPIPIHTTF